MHAKAAICGLPIGLPARGKTFMSKKLGRYLRWLGVKTQVFNVGAYRRRLYGANVSHEFFNLDNPEALQRRNEIADKAFADMLDFFERGGQVGIFDSTLTVMEDARRALVDRLTPMQVQVVFIETICDDPKVIESHIREVKLSMPDYADWAEQDAMQDFIKRIDHHVPHYKHICDPTLSYLQLRQLGVVNNIGEHIIVNNAPSTSDSTFKDDAPLSEAGVAYARTVTDFLVTLRKKRGQTPYPQVLVSPRQRSLQSAQFFPAQLVTQKTPLVQLNPGAVDAMTPAEIRDKWPDEFDRHARDPFNHRYPRSESYHDLALRLEHVILELEGERQDVLVIAHETVLQCLYAYLMDLDETDITSLKIPSKCLIEMVPQAYGTKETRHYIDM